MRVETALKQLLVEEQGQLHGDEAGAQGGRRRMWGSRGRGADKRAPGPLVNWVRDLPSLKSAPQLKQMCVPLEGQGCPCLHSVAATCGHCLIVARRTSSLMHGCSSRLRL